jgi:hypothetical protein
MRLASTPAYQMPSWMAAPQLMELLDPSLMVLVRLMKFMPVVCVTAAHLLLHDIQIICKVCFCVMYGLQMNLRSVDNGLQINDGL